MSRLSASRAFGLMVEVPATPEQAVDFLVDLRGHVGLHPFLESARVVATGTGHAGPWTDWQVVERPQVGSWRYRLRFRVRLTRTSPTTMLADVRAPLTRLTTETVATDSPAGALVAEGCTVEAPWPLIRYVAGSARRAHERTFAMLPDALARPDQG